MWRTRSIFVSSTFQDMQAERDHLRNFIFPELEERLSARRWHTEWVDLRLGVATAAIAAEDARELVVLKVCLEEVRRCRPFLIVLMGDRYGWVPPPDRIATAAREHGFESDLAGRSVTDLEIDFGILSDPHQQGRSFFYLRDPLPYEHMAPGLAALYSDAFAPDGADRVKRMAALKSRIATTLPGRVRRYRAQWDAGRGRVTGLEALGRQVLADLLGELEPELAAAPDEPSWQQAERAALEDFFEDRSRDFVGRGPILARIDAIAASPLRQEGPVGLCMTGAPGCGKSALIGEAVRRVKRSGAFLLVHAAGASPRAPLVDNMLRRWIGELAAPLGIDPALGDETPGDGLHATFASLLDTMAAQRKVVILVDALDQFEATPRGRYVTWLPRQLPANAVFITTAISGDASRALVERGDAELLPLPPIEVGDARGIIERISARYHRVLEAEVVAALLDKRGGDGFVWGNPLWLVLATEEVNLVDADDFSRARRYPGTPAEQLRGLVCDIVAELPSDIAALYGRSFARAETLFGATWARAFLGLIAVGRGGWRELDFRALMPLLTGESWNELRFASLRRLFRGQMRCRGELRQWDFNHVQMRAAVRRRLADQGASTTDLHARIAAHLRALDADDPLRQSETMVHLLESEDYECAVEYYGDIAMAEPEARGALQALMDSVLTAHDGDETGAVRRLALLLAAADADPAARKHAAVRFLFELSAALKDRAALAARIALGSAIKNALDHLLEADPIGNSDLRVCLVGCYHDLANMQREQGDAAAAERTFQTLMQMADRLAKDDSALDLRQVALLTAHEGVGDIKLARGDYAGAEASYRTAVQFFERTEQDWQQMEHHWQQMLSRLGFGEREEHRFQQMLSGYSSKHGEHSEQKVSGLNVKLGDAVKAQGRLDEAAALFRASQAVFERSAALDPTSALRLRDVVVNHNKIGNVQAAGGDFVQAEATFRAMLELAERVNNADPSNMEWQHDLSVAYAKLADVRYLRGDVPEALRLHRQALELRERLVRRDPLNADWQTALDLSRSRLAMLQTEAHGRAKSESSGAPPAPHLPDYRAFMKAVLTGDTAAAQSMISRGFDSTKSETPGTPTPFGVAVGEGFLEIVKLILAAGTDPNASIGSGSAALALAADKGHTEIVKVLLARGAAVDAQEEDGRTALAWAAERGNDEIVACLLDFGADVNHVVHSNGATALHLAAQRHEGTVALLLARGARIDLKTTGGNTALHFAAYNGNTNIVSLLLKHGADPAAVNRQGKSSRDIARESGKADVLRLLGG
jgi:ankyrin repeat protein